MQLSWGLARKLSKTLPTSVSLTLPNAAQPRGKLNIIQQIILWKTPKKYSIAGNDLGLGVYLYGGSKGQE